MKNRLLIFGFFYFTVHLVPAQSSGVYMNAAEFSQGKLSYSFDCSTEKQKAKLNEFLDKDYLTVV